MPRGEIRPLLTPEMLREARKMVGIDQAELARLADVSRKTIVVVERELPAKPDARRRVVLERIRTVFEKKFKIVFDMNRQSVTRPTKSG